MHVYFSRTNLRSNETWDTAAAAVHNAPNPLWQFHAVDSCHKICNNSCSCCPVSSRLSLLTLLLNWIPGSQVPMPPTQLLTTSAARYKEMQNYDKPPTRHCPKLFSQKYHNNLRSFEFLGHTPITITSPQILYFLKVKAKTMLLLLTKVDILPVLVSRWACLEAVWAWLVWPVSVPCSPWLPLQCVQWRHRPAAWPSPLLQCRQQPYWHNHPPPAMQHCIISHKNTSTTSPKPKLLATAVCIYWSL